MLERIELLRNIGQFDSVNTGAQLPFSKLTLLYAENGRGKTTLASILHSLRIGDAELIHSRHRLSTQQPPHVVLNIVGNPPFVFQNGAWSATHPHLAVFGDTFVAQNVCSGIEIASEHRQNLHELILGAQGVTLNSTLQACIDKIEVHNTALREKGVAIPASVRGLFSIDDFCALPADPNIAQAILAAERNLAAAQSAAAVEQQAYFAAVSLPSIDVETISSLLGTGLAELDAATVAHVQAHLVTLGGQGEKWVGDGVVQFASASAGLGQDVCPFCAQPLKNSPIIDHYRAYFSESYSNLKASISATIEEINLAHGGVALAAFERSIRVAAQSREFWKAFVEVPEIAIDTEAISESWRSATEAVSAALLAKQAAPLDPIALPADAVEAISNYENSRIAVSSISALLQAVNEQIAAIKKVVAVADVTTLAAGRTRLRAVEARHSPQILPLCQAYLTEKAAKALTEGARDQARKALDNYRQVVFPAYESATNSYLAKFNSGFRIANACSKNTKTGSTCSYNVLIGNRPVELTSKTGGPSFRNTLSAGDRNTLALAFFFASLDQDHLLAQKIVVIDDPITSLDEHRSLATIQEMRRLIGQVSQIVVLSHSKSLLCALWEGADKNKRTAIKISRSGSGSTFMEWDVHQDCITEHDKRYALVEAHVGSEEQSDVRAVAAALRPILESFLRVAYPTEFPPGKMLGPFIKVCRQRVGTPTQVLSAGDISELDSLREYANKFHHDANPAWKAETINDSELRHFCERTLKFARRA